MRRTVTTAGALALAALVTGGVEAQESGDSGGAGADDGGEEILLAADAPGTSFLEEFDGPLDRELWYVSDGWSNGPHQACAWNARNLRLEDGRALLVLDDTPYAEREGSCAELQSTGYYGHGIYEVRARPIDVSGTVSAFFTYTGPPHGNPWDEIDIEWPGARPGEVELNNWVDGKDAGPDKVVDLPFDASEEMRDYAFEWTRDALRWYVDGKLVRTVDAPGRVGQTAQKIYLSLWSAAPELDGWLGPYAYPGEPAAFEVERVSFTAPGDECQFEGSIACADDR